MRNASQSRKTAIRSIDITPIMAPITVPSGVDESSLLLLFLFASVASDDPDGSGDWALELARPEDAAGPVE